MAGAARQQAPLEDGRGGPGPGMTTELAQNGGTLLLVGKLPAHPVSQIRWVPIGQVEANSYNPNKVASRELKLLYISIKADGYTQPVVTIHDAERNRYIIVDGFHRWLVMKRHADIRKSTGGPLPIVVIDKPPD